jgi:hypothetical protein
VDAKEAGAVSDGLPLPFEADIRGELGELRARVEALEARFGAIESRLQRHESILVSVQTEQHLGRRALEGKLDSILALLKGPP